MAAPSHLGAVIDPGPAISFVHHKPIIMRSLSSLLLFCLTVFAVDASMAQGGAITYPLRTTDGLSVAVHLPDARPTDRFVTSVSGIVIRPENGRVTVDRWDPDDPPVLIRQHAGRRDTVALDIEPAGDVIRLHRSFMRSVGAWTTAGDDQEPFLDLLTTIVAEDPSVGRIEALSVAQRLFDGPPVNADRPLREALASLKQSDGEKPPCDCSFILNHFADANPLDRTVGTYGPGYYWAGGDARFSSMVGRVRSHSSSSSRWHQWKMVEQGPAHSRFLRQYDSRGHFKYEWSTLGMDNAVGSPSPDHAYTAFQFLCIDGKSDRTKPCDCTKEVGVFYGYNARLSVIARKLRPTAKVSSAVEELAVLTVENTDGVHVLDAGRGMVQTECNGDFNFEFLENTIDLAGAVVNMVADIKDTVNGGVLTDIATHIDTVGDALVTMASTPVIEQSGSCTDVVRSGGLLRGYRRVLLSANDPTTISLSSFSFLGTSGKKKWDNYATIGTDFFLQAIVSPGSLEKNPDCCSDKLTTFLAGSQGGPLTRADHLATIEGLARISGPWDDFTPVGYRPVIPPRTSRGYLVWTDPQKKCAEVKPKALEMGAAAIASTPIPEDEIEPTTRSVQTAGRVTIFPNPARDVLHVRWTEGVSHREAMLLDATGRVVLRSVIPENAQSWSIRRGVADLPRGRYVLMLRGPEDTLSRSVLLR